MYEELIKELRRPHADCDPWALMEQAADAIEELAECLELSKKYETFWNKEAKETLRRFQVAVANKPRWIPVTERLPNEQINLNTRDFEYVLCGTIWGDVRPFKYGTPIGQKDAHFWNGAGYVDAYVTHWMPLPEPPKEET